MRDTQPAGELEKPPTPDPGAAGFEQERQQALRDARDLSAERMRVAGEAASAGVADRSPHPRVSSVPAARGGQEAARSR